MIMSDDLLDLLCGGELDEDYPIRQKKESWKMTLGRTK